MIFDVLILISVIVGIGLIVFSVVNFNPKNKDKESEAFETDYTIKKLEASINDADNAIEELSKLSENIFEEISLKYQELLYLYSLIDEKHKELNYGNEKTDVSVVNNTSTPNLNVNNKDLMSVLNSSNPKHKEIRELNSRGLSVSEIAKKLNLGQGEVKLVLELGKGR